MQNSDVLSLYSLNRFYCNIQTPNPTYTYYVYVPKNRCINIHSTFVVPFPYTHQSPWRVRLLRVSIGGLLDIRSTIEALLGLHQGNAQ